MLKNCSYVGRFEYLQDDLNEICDLIGHPRVILPHVWKTNHECYLDYYTPEMIDIVRKASSGDVEMFGFDFGTTATKNVGKLK